MMSKRCKYALKALICISKNKEGVIKASQIASKENIPRKFLEQILSDLKNSAYIGSKQGSEGGYFLLKKAADIRFSDIYRLFDGAIALLPCVSEKFYYPCEDCLQPESCQLKFYFAQLRNQTYQIMEKMTIESLSNLPDFLEENPV